MNPTPSIPQQLLPYLILMLTLAALGLKAPAKVSARLSSARMHRSAQSAPQHKLFSISVNYPVPNHG